ncbi:unnamed protein product [Lota lota]
MDRKNGGLSSKSLLIPVSRSSVVFDKVLAPLQNAYLHEESKEAFRYPSAFLFKNPTLQEKYEAFRANRREAGYSEEELKEGYGFLLFDDINKAAELGETGVLTGNSTCKTLGDPSKGVYIARYSDCLAPDHWYSGKSGFIVIVRLTKGRSNKVKENYTQNCISPSVGFDCHESKELPLVSANTSSFLAFERTQYYLYEALPGDCVKTNLAPRHVCPFAIVPFSYDDANTRVTMSCSQKQRDFFVVAALNDFMWRGQLQISSQIFHVWLKSRARALIPVKLPPVVKVDQAVSMVTLRQFAPKAVFETRFSGEVCLDGICCSVHEFVPIEVEDPSLSLLIRELKDKDLGLTVHLNDSGFLILLHSSNFATCTGNGSTVTEALQAMFLFPGSRAIHKDTRGESEHSQISSDILRGLPALDYAEIEMQKSSMGPSEDISGQFVQQIKNYAALIQTGLAATQSKDVSPVSQDYDESVTSLFSNPKWTNRLWQWLRSYLSHPVSFQLPVYSVTELLAAGNKLQKEVLNEDLPPLEQGPGTVCSTGPEELLIKSTACDVSSSWQKDVDKKDSETNSILNCPLSRNPAAELVVSITSAEGMSKVMDEGLSGSDAVVATKQLCNTLMATTNTVDKNPLEDSTERKKRPRGRPKGKRKRFKWSSPPADEPLTPTSDKPDEETLANDTPETEWTILSMSQCKGGKLTYKYKKVPRSPQLQEDQIEQTKSRRMENVSSTRSDDCSLLKKTDRWDLRPILTACGRTLVPFGSLNSLLQKDESAHRERRLKETLSETSEEASQQKKMEEDPVAGGLAAHSTNNVISEDGCHNTEVGSPRSETASSPPELRDRSVVNVAEADSTGHVSSSTADDPSHLTDRDKSERLLCKLKKLFSRRKRKTTPLVLGDSVLPVDAQLSTETLLKKRKSDKETLNTESNTDCQDSRESNKDVLIAFAQALGLMPIEVPDKREETENMDTLEQRLPLSLEGQLIPPEVESAQVMQMVPSPVQENPQMKRVLQKRRTKWGKLFHTPSSSTTKRPKNNECATSNSFEMNLKEQFCSNGQSNALSLLADLALGDNQALPQLDPRSNVDNLLSDGTKLDNQLVLPSMLQQPADGPVLPSNSPSPEGILGSKDVIGLIAKEHDYSWSTASQVPKTTSPAGTPEHSQNLSGPELPTLSSVPPEGPREHRASVEYMNKDAIRSRRFRRSRIFVENDGFLQVTRKWKGNYDFDLDSKFTNHPVEKTVCRGLHGSWNSAVKDNGEEAQLLIHIWIGLFYSRSTPRFIHSSPLDLEDCLERSDGNVSLPTVPEAAPVAVWNSDTQYLEPIQEDRLFLNQGAEILDLSIKKQDLNDRSDISVSRHETNGKEASEAFIREAGIQDGGPAQYQAKQKALQVYRSRPSEFDDDNDGNDDNIVKSTSKRANASPPSATNREHSAVNSLSEEKTCDSLCKVIANIIIQPQLVVETQASIDPESSHIDTSEMRERKENLQNAEVAVDPPIETDSACEIMKGIVEDPISLCTVLVATEENDHDESKCEDHRNNADSCLPLIDKEDSTTGHKSPVPYVNLPENETQSADVRSITLTHGSKENRNEDEDCQSAISCDQQEQDDELMENEEETSYILAQKAASHHPAPSPQDGVSKLLQDPSEMPLFVKDDSKQEVEAGPQVLPFQDNPVELGHEPKEMATNIDVCHTSLVNGEKVPIAENVLSVFKDRDSKHKLGSEDSELDERCSPPTKGNGPVDYFQLSLVGEPNEGDGTKDASSDEMLQTQYANAYSFMAVGVGDYDGDDVVSEENLNIALDKTLPEEPDHNDSINEANIEIVSQQNKSENDPTPLQDGVEGESQAEVEPDVSVVSCDHQEPDDELVENEVETACILAQTSGPQVLPSEMANEPNEMAMNINVYHMSLENSKKVQIDKNILSVFKECNSEHKLGSETSEFDERCPTPTIDEKPYEDFPSLELSISNEQGQNSTHCLGKEVDAEPELKAVGDQVPGRDLCEDSQTPSYRLLETTDLPPSLHHSPTLRRESMDMDNLNDKTSLVNVGITPAKQLRVKRSRFSDVGCSLLVPCPLKKMSNDRKKCGAPVQRRLRDASHPYRLNPVVVLQPLTGLQWTDSQAVDIYKVKEMDNPAISKMSDDNQTKIPVIPTTLTDTLLDNRRDVSNLTSKGDQHENEQELCSKADRVSVHGAGECVLNKTNDIDALSHVEGRDPWKPSTTVPSIVSTQSDEGDNLSSSSFQDPIQDCPVAKRLGHSSSIHTDPSTSSFKYTNYRFTKTVSKSLGQLTETCMNSDLTQFSMEQEFLIFSEEMKQLLIGSKRGPGKNPDHRSMHSYPSSDGPQSVLDLSMDVDEPESGMEETKGEKISRHRELSSRGNSAEADVALSNIEAECARSYHTVMDNICAGRSCMTETEGALRERAGPIRQMRREMFGSLNHGLNLVVRQSSKTKFKFYILKTSEDAFFKETKAQLEGDGHTEEQPYHFLLNTQSSSSSLLLIILKNEDIAEHIIKVPHLLDLKKSANVLFAGIDHPKDIGNLTHQDIFKKGGFIVLEGIALEALRFCQMKALLDFLQELSKNGKWKWILHYRDIRRLKENSRFNAEEMEKKNLMKSCQETGIVEVLPYHECDQTCRPHPRYLKCLLQLQVQNITARFPVFVTDITNPTEDKSFERHGILTMNINSLLNVIESEKFSPSTSI